MPKAAPHPGQFVVHIVAGGEGFELELQVVVGPGHGGVLQRAEASSSSGAPARAWDQSTG